jgi:diguanylate cyclase (GGDEF)-like protein
VARLGSADRRGPGHDRELLKGRMEVPEPIQLPGHALRDVFEIFRRHKDRNQFPVVDARRRPLGLLTERDLKEYVYSPYGKDLLMNRSLGKQLVDLITPVPVAPLETRLESVLEMLALDPAAEGILLTHEGSYAGFLSARALLQALNEKNLALAREQNPLTRLPGNRTIHEHLSEVLARREPRALIYLDIDHFKPFNDVHGFRLGDRVLLLMADLLRSAAAGRDCFIGHIGGDDFLVSAPLSEEGREGTAAFARALLEKFRGDALAFHPRAVVEAGGYRARDREGRTRRYRTLSASAGIIYILSEGPILAPDAVAGILAGLKQKAKAAPDRLASAEL